jgi:hypothetical protein
VLKRLQAGLPVHGSPTLCSQGRKTDIDTRGSIFIDLQECASTNPEAVLAPICELHFSADPSLQPQLERERKTGWQRVSAPSAGLAVVREALGTANSQKRRRGTTASA